MMTGYSKERMYLPLGYLFFYEKVQFECIDIEEVTHYFCSETWEAV